MFGLITGALGLAGSAVQAISAAKKGREAKKAAAAAFRKAQSVQDVDEMSWLQSPDIRKLVQDTTARNTAASIQAVKEMGPEGAANVSNIYQQALSSDLEAGQAQAVQDLNVAKTIAANKQDLANRKTSRDFTLFEGELMGAHAASADARSMMNTALGSAASSAGLMGEDIYRMTHEDDPWGSGKA